MILLGLLACLGYSDGQARRGELHCEWLDTCGELAAVGFESVEACATAATDQPFDDADCPDYDAGAMAACLDTYREAIAAKDCAADVTTACLVCG